MSTAANPSPRPPGPPRATVGRIVHYYDEYVQRKGQPYPAIVTHVHADGYCNLCVLQDGQWMRHPGECKRVRVPPEHLAGRRPVEWWEWPPRD